MSFGAGRQFRRREDRDVCMPARMSGAVTPSAALPVRRYSAPYFDGVLGVAVRDERRHAFATLDAIGKRGRLTIVYPSTRRLGR